MTLALDRVGFAYPGRDALFENASLTIADGSFVLVRGASGAGKSTLLRLLCRLEEAQAGRILLDGVPIDAMDPADLRRSVAYVQQMPILLPGTVRDNLLLPFSFKANNALIPPTDEALAAMLGGFLLDGVTPESRADTLSVGQAQRVCLIRSLLLGPGAVLMDEPTASLDADSAGVVLAKAAELSRQGMTVIMVSHSPDTPAGITHVVRVTGRALEYA
ncbi:MAG: ATP-binding cassette domain-containing protein [Pseudodesulfovibrio sp.]|uniref:ABC transporter related protein n=1 Tax=Pseudodesulfovibrio aespoeensis (strain ATCC 700646 / DSM 10631 / Aspo-2) TaxID=643562 RepID=E6VYA9_PSEA9|nr:MULTISPECIES: ABC transporter ATP-binding protein [Pseudodesulfovibrio]MBU4191235.1 ATP-binding cassette domain-containing protein [Pseudomonadota bacterium]MCG2731988.1 ABC transporter ATP-binding protein [Pseudodesulfovibrio aespoeensis]ADU61567.1 ABC transporter related protein [Pseudodesulfovibrio aespoeensis Aspo-2]MBU4243610.1 ATP-binding cassette domain-containing protein [Pseudomonadota bacterium]MBU4379200.1 ATP-binding cassette domain-containing protein [Pseudomonadota bacterium]